MCNILILIAKESYSVLPPSLCYINPLDIESLLALTIYPPTVLLYYFENPKAKGFVSGTFYHRMRKTRQLLFFPCIEQT